MRFAVNPERQVREGLLEGLAVIVERDRKWLLPLLKEIVPFWLGLTWDPVASLGAKAQNLFDRAFSKQGELARLINRRIVHDEMEAGGGDQAMQQSLIKVAQIALHAFLCKHGVESHLAELPFADDTIVRHALYRLPDSVRCQEAALTERIPALQPAAMAMLVAHRPSKERLLAFCSSSYCLRTLSPACYPQIASLIGNDPELAQALWSSACLPGDPIVDKERLKGFLKLCLSLNVDRRQVLHMALRDRRCAVAILGSSLIIDLAMELKLDSELQALAELAPPPPPLPRWWCELMGRTSQSGQTWALVEIEYVAGRLSLSLALTAFSQCHDLNPSLWKILHAKPIAQLNLDELTVLCRFVTKLTRTQRKAMFRRQKIVSEEHAQLIAKLLSPIDPFFVHRLCPEMILHGDTKLPVEIYLEQLESFSWEQLKECPAACLGHKKMQAFLLEQETGPLADLLEYWLIKRGLRSCSLWRFLCRELWTEDRVVAFEAIRPALGKLPPLNPARDALPIAHRLLFLLKHHPRPSNRLIRLVAQALIYHFEERDAWATEIDRLFLASIDGLEQLEERPLGALLKVLHKNPRGRSKVFWLLNRVPMSPFESFILPSSSFAPLMAFCLAKSPLSEATDYILKHSAHQLAADACRLGFSPRTDLLSACLMTTRLPQVVWTIMSAVAIKRAISEDFWLAHDKQLAELIEATFAADSAENEESGMELAAEALCVLGDQLPVCFTPLVEHCIKGFMAGAEERRAVCQLVRRQAVFHQSLISLAELKFTDKLEQRLTCRFLWCLMLDNHLLNLGGKEALNLADLITSPSIAAALTQPNQSLDLIAIDIFLSSLEGAREDGRLYEQLAAFCERNLLWFILREMHWLEGERVHRLPLDQYEVLTGDFEQAMGKDPRLAAALLYGRLLKALPALMRQLLEGRPEIVQLTSRYYTPGLIARELARIRRYHADANLSLRCEQSSTQCAIQAAYKLDEASASLRLEIPPTYPLAPVRIVAGERLAISEARWQQWLLACQSMFIGSNLSSLLAGLLAWKENVERTFAGIDPCSICYCIVHPTEKALPGPACKTCRQKFHAACLYKWFKSGGQATCPMCRSLF